MGATETVSQWIVETSIEDIPPDAMRVTQESCFDCIGVILAGAVQPVGQIVAEYIHNQGGTLEATVLGSGMKTSATNAALVNGTMGHALDYDDFGGHGHPTVVLLPSLLALGEKVGASGRQLVEAFVVGCEVGIALHQAAHYNQMKRGFHSTAVFGRMAGAAACAKLLKLDHHQTITALGIAGSLAGGLIHNLGSMTKPLHAGLAARDSVMAVQLASMGLTAGQHILEHPAGFINSVAGEGSYDLEAMAENLGKPFITQESLYIKKYPCCATNHTMLDSILGLMQEHQFNHRDVEWVEVTQQYLAPVLLFNQPEDELQAKFSVVYNTAAALVDGRVGTQTFTPERIADPTINETMGKVRINVPSHWTLESDAYHAGGAVRVRLTDGRELAHAIPREQILGGQKNPWGMDNITEKFQANAGFVLPQGKVAKATETWSRIDQIANISDALDSLVVDGR